LRGLPYGIPKNRQGPAQKALVLGIFRGLWISYMNHEVPKKLEKYTNKGHTISDLRDIADFLHSAFRFQDTAAADYGYAIAFAASGSVRSAEYVVKAARASRLQFAQKAFWEAIEHDCNALNSPNKGKALKSLSAEALWPSVLPSLDRLVRTPHSRRDSVLRHSQ
jgi:hypothetical protein